ncbi:hypothetical protein [Streptomyces sp. NPDC050856]|uniref:hypothetical protein n=1 Tax=Streptomyces sp. NPDC050856 TaxID=3154939 RepID=UPI0033E92458
MPSPGQERARVPERTGADAPRLEPARRLDRTVFPADRRSLLEGLRGRRAPDAALTAPGSPPVDGTTYHSAGETAPLSPDTDDRTSGGNTHA